MEERGVGLIGALLEHRYRVDALLARGGMSSVYRGLDTRLDRRVAIKVMDARFADDRTFVDRFEREARSAAKIHHPNVVAVHDQGVDITQNGNLVYLVMELVDGGTLRDLITERGALEVPLALSIMEPVLAALAAAHRVGLVHRDVKPENVLIGHGGESGTAIKVADFGLVRAVHSAGTTNSSVILGTVAYLSPEQVTTGAATVRGDVYSAGIVLYEALTGVPPYTGDTALSIAYRHVNDDVPAPSQTVAGIPRDVDELVLRATRRDPAARPADGAAFLDELLSLRTRLAIPKMPVPVPEPTQTDRTVPVSPVDRASALAEAGPATGAGPAPVSAPVPVVAPPTDAETTTSGQLDLSELAPAGINATIVRPAPGGFRPVGPQGTRAMLRADLDRAAPPRHAQPPMMPAGPPPPPPQDQRLSPPPPSMPPKPPSRAGRIVLWSAIAVLVLALVGTTTWWFTAGRFRTVPNVTNVTEVDARTTLEGEDLDPKVVREYDNKIRAGRVIRTDPKAGEQMLRGDQVTVVVSSGKPKVPDVPAGTDVTVAEKRITAAGLTPDKDDGKNEFSDDVAKDKVIRLDPQPGTELDVGKRVVIIISKGAKPKPVPDVKNMSKDEAFEELQSNGYEPFELEAEFSADVDGGHVISTDPPAGEVVEGDNKRVGVVLSTAVTVPDLNQRTVEEATSMLEELGLQIDAQVFGGGEARVVAQSPSPNSRVEAGSTVTVYAVG